MRKYLIIIIAVVFTALNINTYGSELTEAQLEKAKIIAQSNTEITLEKSINWTLGLNLFKFIHFAELMFLSEVSRRQFLS
jgi:hypothetical protein